MKLKVSPLTAPVALAVKPGLAAPYVRVASAALTVRVAGVTVIVAVTVWVV